MFSPAYKQIFCCNRIYINLYIQFPFCRHILHSSSTLEPVAGSKVTTTVSWGESQRAQKQQCRFWTQSSPLSRLRKKLSKIRQSHYTSQIKKTNPLRATLTHCIDVFYSRKERFTTVLFFRRPPDSLARSHICSVITSISTTLILLITLTTLARSFQS